MWCVARVTCLVKIMHYVKEFNLSSCWSGVTVKIYFVNGCRVIRNAYFCRLWEAYLCGIELLSIRKEFSGFLVVTVVRSVFIVLLNKCN